MPNENIMGIPTKACINGVTKEETERLKNALIKKIEDNETTVNVTEDGKVIVADNSGFYLSYDGNMIGIEQDISGDYIPKTVPYLPEDANENPLAPPNDTIMTSANIAVDPRIVRTTGNQVISGTKTFSSPIYNISNQNWFNGIIGSKSLSNYITSRKYSIDNSSYDDHMLIGTTYANPTQNYVQFRAYAPRTNFGDTTEKQNSIAVYIRVNNDGNGVVYLQHTDINGTAKEKVIGRFTNGDWE